MPQRSSENTRLTWTRRSAAVVVKALQAGADALALISRSGSSGGSGRLFIEGEGFAVDPVSPLKLAESTASSQGPAAFRRG
jgi:hypothetical protein